MPAQWHLAHMNVGWARWDIDQPEMAGFFEQVPAINAVAASSPGFVWQWDGGFDHPRIVMNVSVWETIESLKNFSYRSAHGGVYRDRSRWFEGSEEANYALWWVPAGHQPAREEAESRLELLRKAGPTQDAFTFARAFPPPGYESEDSTDSSISSAADA